MFVKNVSLECGYHFKYTSRSIWQTCVDPNFFIGDLPVCPIATSFLSEGLEVSGEFVDFAFAPYTFSNRVLLKNCEILLIASGDIPFQFICSRS